MRFVTFQAVNGQGLAVRHSDGVYRGLASGESGYPGSLKQLLGKGTEALHAAAHTLSNAPIVAHEHLKFLPPVPDPDKIICIGLNYADHSAESGFDPPQYPTVFARYATSLIGHGAPIVRPASSDQLDYEGELVAIIGTGGRHISQHAALEHVAGYSIFNDASVRDYQFRSPQWTMGKTWDGTGAFGPEFVSADELPPGAAGLHLQTRLNGSVVQSASTDNLIFTVAALVRLISEVMTLAPGDVIVTGTPAGVGLARKPPLYMKPGDICEVEIERLGVLSNVVRG